MRYNVLPMLKKYFDWWIVTLLSCLPEKLVSYFSKYNRQVDLIIAHQGDTIFIQDKNGRIIDSIAVKTASVAEDQANAELDFNVHADSDDTNDRITDAIDIDLADDTDVTEVVHQLFKDKPVTGGSSNIDKINIRGNDDTTILFNREDSTTRLLDMVSEEDTLIINDDQGTLLTIIPQEMAATDNTVVYRNDRGKIRPVERDLESVTESDVDIDLLLNEQDELETEDDSGYAFHLAANLVQKYKGRKKCLYLIPDESVFSLKLTYAIEALENIESVLRFDLEKHIPLSFHEVRFFYALNINSSKNKVDVDVVVIKTTDYDELLSAFESDRGQSIVCTTQYFYQNYGTKVNFLVGNQKTTGNTLFSGNTFHTAVNVIFLMALLMLPYYLYYEEMVSADVKTDQEIKKVGTIVSTINELNSEITLGSKLSQQIKNDLRMVYLLAQLSEHIRTDAWITRFTYKNGEIKIKGEASSATTVSDSLNDTGLFESIKFISSIIKNPQTKKESFELSLRVKSNA